MEIWKTIEEHAETQKLIRREISNFGRIKNIHNNNTVRKRPYKPDTFYYGSYDKDGYRTANLNSKTFKIHYLVCKYFIGERPENMDIDHIDRDKTNNHISNLRYCSRRINNLNRECVIKKKGTIRKNKSGTYRFRYRMGNKQKSKTFKTERQAKVAQAIYMGAINILEKY